MCVSVEHGSDGGIVTVDNLVEGVGEAAEKIRGSGRNVGDDVDVVSGVLGALELIDKPGELTIGVVLHGLLIQPEIEGVVKDGVKRYDAELPPGIFDRVGTVRVGSISFSRGANPVIPVTCKGIVCPLNT